MLKKALHQNSLLNNKKSFRRVTPESLMYSSALKEGKIKKNQRNLKPQCQNNPNA